MSLDKVIMRAVLMIVGLVTIVAVIAHGVIVPDFHHFVHALQIAHNPVPSLPSGN